MHNITFADWGLIDYKKAWDEQKVIFDKLMNQKLHIEKSKHDPLLNNLIFCEHPHVYTLGKSGQQNNLLINDEFLAKINATYYHIDRGGDITYHGPGHLVGYPIIDLEYFGISLKRYIEMIEEAIILTLTHYDIHATRLEGATGVWLDVDNPESTRKICAIGVKASRYVTMHGFALNVNTDLSYFNHINPCGFVDKGVTSIWKEKSEKIDFDELKALCAHSFAKVFDFKYHSFFTKNE
jgi:lipoyl(octanoyl) transferase